MEPNFLKLWRLRKNITLEGVDELLMKPKGWTAQCEGVGFLKIPCDQLYELMGLYKVSEFEWMCAILFSKSHYLR